MTLKQLCWLIAIMLFSAPVWADESLEPLLNKVALSLHAEQWVTTQTALVNVGINAAVADQNIVNVQNEIMQKLKQFSKNGDWHVLSFDRQLDKSGLETIHIVAQARLPQPELGNLRDKAKAISKPGEAFTIDDVQFTPSEDELRQAKTALRNNIYQLAKAELDTLNKLYTDQKYYIHQIDFISQLPSPVPSIQNAMYMKAYGSMPRPAAPLSIGNKAELEATVVLAAMPDQLAQKLTHSP